MHLFLFILSKVWFTIRKLRRQRELSLVRFVDLCSKCSTLEVKDPSCTGGRLVVAGGLLPPFAATFAISCSNSCLTVFNWVIASFQSVARSLSRVLWMVVTFFKMNVSTARNSVHSPSTCCFQSFWWLSSFTMRFRSSSVVWVWPWWIFSVN